MEEKKDEVFESVHLNEENKECTEEQTQVQDNNANQGNKSIVLLGKSIPQKFIILASAIVLTIITLIVTLTLIFTKHPIDKLFDKIEEEDSYQMRITLSIDSSMDESILEMKVDGNIIYTSDYFGDEKLYENYIEIIGDDTYIYRKNAWGTWTKEKIKDDNASDNSSTANQFVQDFAELFNSKNYKKIDKDEYEQKKSVSFDSYDDVVIKIDEDTCIVKMNITYDGVTLPAKIVIYDIGDVELTLPNQ